MILLANKKKKVSYIDIAGFRVDKSSVVILHDDNNIEMFNGITGSLKPVTWMPEKKYKTPLAIPRKAKAVREKFLENLDECNVIMMHHMEGKEIAKLHPELIEQGHKAYEEEFKI